MIKIIINCPLVFLYFILFVINTSDFCYFYQEIERALKSISGVDGEELQRVS